MTRLHAASTSTLFTCFRSNNMDVDDITIDSSANWKVVERPKDTKEDEGTGNTLGTGRVYYAMGFLRRYHYTR